MIKFEFVNAGEFGDPYYIIRNGDVNIGKAYYIYGSWYCQFYLGHLYGILTLTAIAEKLKELNESLAKQRKEYFGLI